MTTSRGDALTLFSLLRAAAEKHFRVYAPGLRADVVNAEVEGRFMCARKDDAEPYSLHAEVSFALDTATIDTLIYGGKDEEESEEDRAAGFGTAVAVELKVSLPEQAKADPRELLKTAEKLLEARWSAVEQTEHTLQGRSLTAYTLEAHYICNGPDEVFSAAFHDGKLKALAQLMAGLPAGPKPSGRGA